MIPAYIDTRKPSTSQLQAQRDMWEETTAKRRATLALDMDPDWPNMVGVEMILRVHEALELMDWIEDTLPMFDDDYSDWVEETQSLRHGG